MSAAKKLEPVEWLTTGEVGALLGLTAKGVRDYLDRGSFPNASRPPGGHWRVPRSDVNDILARWRKR
jgi:excisionase family DNA binding protein